MQFNCWQLSVERVECVMLLVANVAFKEEEQVIDVW